MGLFFNTVPCEEETNIAVASIMTFKIGLIWRHMKTLKKDVGTEEKSLLINTNDCDDVKKVFASEEVL